MGSEEIQKSDRRLRRFPQTEAGRQREAHEEGQYQIQMRNMQKSAPETVPEGKEVRTNGVIRWSTIS